jgi:dTDP-4-dehydrorhamnose reductase
LVVSPTYVPDLVDAVLDLLIDGETGLRHLANSSAVSWAEFARLVAGALDLDTRLVQGAAAETFEWPAPRPPYAALATERGQLLPPLENAIARYASVMRKSQFPPEAEALAESAPDMPARAK